MFTEEGAGIMYWVRNGYYIEYDFYGREEYSVQYCGDDIIFDTLEEAQAFIDGLEEDQR